MAKSKSSQVTKISPKKTALPNRDIDSHSDSTSPFQLNLARQTVLQWLRASFAVYNPEYRQAFSFETPSVMPTVSVDKAALFKELGRE